MMKQQEVNLYAGLVKPMPQMSVPKKVVEVPVVKEEEKEEENMEVSVSREVTKPGRKEQEVEMEEEEFQDNDQYFEEDEDEEDNFASGSLGERIITSRMCDTCLSKNYCKGL
eukprot:TRINITY_DN507_c0_g1_i6.p2 TRINITY_DN507_c0_g1~~TRINITY_DN507_c0_g1_i6.p2  ORF type:complete len:112 (-),score=46.34 TRINITY_DN507_c0_g1_i6:156-491(-)